MKRMLVCTAVVFVSLCPLGFGHPVQLDGPYGGDTLRLFANGSALPAGTHEGSLPRRPVSEMTVGSPAARTIHVPKDYPTIQQGINAAVPGDSVVVAPGVYKERLNIHVKLFLASEADAEHTIINSSGFGGGAQSWVIQVGSNCSISGFTLRSADPYTFGVDCIGASIDPIIEHNIIEDLSYSGLFCWDSSAPLIRNNLIRGNAQTGIIMNTSAKPLIANNTIVNNGAGVAVYVGSHPLVKNNIIVGNGIGIMSSGGSITINSFNDLWNNGSEYAGESKSGPGDISVDPMFVGGTPYDYRLRSNSPCINAGDPTFPMDPDSTVTDMGAFYFDHTPASPPAPCLLLPSNGSLNQRIPVTLQWVRAERATSYRVVIAGDSSFRPSTILVDSTCQNTQLVVARLSNLTKYYWRVNARGVAGQGPWSVIWTFSTSRGGHVIRVPGDYSTIQRAVDAAASKDSVLVEPGVYHETVTLRAGVSLIGSGYINTIIDGDGRGNSSGSVVVGADSCLISGFTVRNASPEALNNLGAGIDASTCSFTIRNNWITNCRIGIFGFGSPVVEGNVIIRNLGLAGIYFSSATSCALVANNSILNNYRGVETAGGAHPTIVNNIVVGNAYGVINFDNGGISPRYNDVFGNTTNYNGLPDLAGQQGNIAVNPLFVQPDSNDYHLQAGSPCIDAGDPSRPRDPDGTLADLGAFSFFHSMTSLIACYPLSSDPNDITGHHAPMLLTNAPFQDGGIYCNGIYMFSGDPHHCHAITPTLADFNFNSFTISAKFMVTEYPTFSERPVFVGGNLYRWIGFILQPNGTVLLRYNNNADQPSTVHYTLNAWHEARITYDGSTLTGRLYLDTSLACAARFKLEHGNNANVGITNFANATAFRGWLCELKIAAAGGPETGIAEGNGHAPETNTLAQNYPNPFNPTTAISYRLSTNSFVTLKVYDVLGREVATLVNEAKPAGSYTVEFNAKGLASGAYFYRITAGSFVQTRRLLLLR